MLLQEKKVDAKNLQIKEGMDINELYIFVQIYWTSKDTSLLISI